MLKNYNISFKAIVEVPRAVQKGNLHHVGARPLKQSGQYICNQPFVLLQSVWRFGGDADKIEKTSKQIWYRTDEQRKPQASLLGMTYQTEGWH